MLEVSAREKGFSSNNFFHVNLMLRKESLSWEIERQNELSLIYYVPNT